MLHRWCQETRTEGQWILIFYTYFVLLVKFFTSDLLSEFKGEARRTRAQCFVINQRSNQVSLCIIMNHPLESNSINAPMLQSHTITTVMEWIASVKFNALQCTAVQLQCNAMQCEAKWLLITAACSNAMSGQGWLARTTIYDYPDNGESKKHKFVAHHTHTGDLVHSSDLALLWFLMISYLMLKDILLPLNHMSYHSKLKFDGLIPQSSVHTLM